MEANDPGYFDEQAATWDDDPAKVERAAMVARAIAATIDLGPHTSMLEYGAGTGLVTQAMQADVGPVTLAEPSEGMRAVIRSKVEAGTLVAEAIWSLNLATDPVPEQATRPDGQFDLVVTVLTLHHITELDRVLSGFAQMLAPGGHLCVVDLDREDGSFHGHGFAGHHGFDRDDLARQLTSAGFGSVSFSDCGELVRDGVAYPMFLAVAGDRSTDQI